jgi:hypothetical protein
LLFLSKQEDTALKYTTIISLKFLKNSSCKILLLINLTLLSNNLVVRVKVKVQVKVNFTQEKGMKAQMGSTGIAVLFL